jgi:ketosteroid isomerase-like protein
MTAPKPSSFTARSPKISFVHSTLTAAFEAGDSLVHTKAMERTLVDTVQQIYAALGKGDIEEFMSYFNDDVVVDLHVPEEFLFRRHAEGKKEARELVLANFKLLESQAPQITGVIAQGDTVIVTMKEIGVIRATGAPYSVEVNQQFTFRGGKVWRFNEVAAIA